MAWPSAFFLQVRPGIPSDWLPKLVNLPQRCFLLGTAVGGLFLPLVLPAFIRSRGAGATLRGLSIAILVLLTLAFPFIKPRLPESRVHGPGRRSRDNKVWLRDGRFWLVLLASTFQSFAYFLPAIWLPSGYYQNRLIISPDLSSPLQPMLLP